MRIISSDEAMVVLATYWRENDIPRERQRQDISDLYTYMTISIGKNRRMQKAGTRTWAILESGYEPVPRAWIDEWMVGP